MFAMYRPSLRANIPRQSNPAVQRPTEGVMTNGAANITLNNTESLVVNEESPLLISEKGEKGEKGDVGPRGKKGSPGKQGPKVLSWSKHIELHDEVNSLITFPHDNNEYSISKLDIIVQGKGEVTFYLVEEQTGEKLATVSSSSVDEMTIISHQDVVKPASAPVILTLQAVATIDEQDEPMKFLSFTVTLKRD